MSKRTKTLILALLALVLLVGAMIITVAQLFATGTLSFRKKEG